MSIILLATCALLAISILFILNSYINIRQKYLPIIDIEKELSKIKTTIENQKKEYRQFEVSFKDKKEKLSAEYNAAHDIYVKLINQIAVLEENCEMLDFGLYKPHYAFDTSKKYRMELERVYEEQKALVKSNLAVKCDTEWTVGGSKVEGRKMIGQSSKLMLRAFNGESDAAIAKVEWNNVAKMEERIKKAFEVINKAGGVNRCYVTNDYLNTKLKELYLVYEYREKVYQEKEEQRRIQQEMREEEKAQREIEKAKIDAEKEEQRYQKALEKAREEVQIVKGDKLDELNGKIQKLEKLLAIAQEQKERAISRAQLTKSGHVYIISNIGSFGEQVLKIGMTRRLEPLDRIRELGDASVPFQFDVHAMIYSENAPELENKIHNHFSEKRINLVNFRKEFFELTLDELEQWATENNVEMQLTKIAEAREYRETQSIKIKGKNKFENILNDDMPNSINSIFDSSPSKIQCSANVK